MRVTAGVEVRRRALAIASVLVAAPIAASATIVPATAATVETVVLGDYGTWTVPTGVTSVTLALAGGDGGTTTNSGPGTAAIGAGGRGGTLTATLQVASGDELFARVGTAGNGTDLSDIVNALDGTGYNDGGAGWSTGGGSTGLNLNGVLVAGAPGGGAGAGALALTSTFEVFSSAG